MTPGCQLHFPRYESGETSEMGEELLKRVQAEFRAPKFERASTLNWAPQQPKCGSNSAQLRCVISAWGTTSNGDTLRDDQKLLRRWPGSTCETQLEAVKEPVKIGDAGQVSSTLISN